MEHVAPAGERAPSRKRRIAGEIILLGRALGQRALAPFVELLDSFPEIVDEIPERGTLLARQAPDGAQKGRYLSLASDEPDPRLLRERRDRRPRRRPSRPAPRSHRTPKRSGRSLIEGIPSQSPRAS